MFDVIQSYIPAEWQRTVEFFGAPLWWIPSWQALVLGYAVGGSTTAELVGKAVFLLPPLLVVVVAMWATMGSLYTMPFRSGRVRFVTTMAYAWWDAGRSIWFFWVGVVRVLLLLVGWLWGLLRLAVRLALRALKTTIESPFVVLDWTTRRYFQPGVPWIAFLLLLGWCALEGTIFTYTLRPTLTEVFSNITGSEPSAAVLTPILWIVLFLVIAGSFACIEGLARAVGSRNWGRIVEMAVVELTVMFFEVMFLYRELIDAITPWIAQQTGAQLGLWSTVALASIGWMGVRGVTWFLFGRYGTPAVVAVLSRETIANQEASLPAQFPVQTGFASEVIAAFKKELEWFKLEGKHVAEVLSLPILQLFAVAVNFPVLVVRGEPLFRLPFQSLEDVLATTSALPRNGAAVPRRASA
jgi:hypothetical protein